jgi:hypothetical protein
MNRALLASILLLISFALVGTYAVGPPSAETPIAAVRLTANYTCSSDCDDSTNDHIQFGGVVFENNTSVVDCDIATGYTTTADVASKGRCVLYEPGTYEFTFYGGFDFSAATGVANVVVYDSTNSLSLGLLNILPLVGMDTHVLFCRDRRRRLGRDPLCRRNSVRNPPTSRKYIPH